MSELLALINCGLAGTILVSLWYHHRAGVSGPCSASVRLLRAISDLQIRLEVVERLVAANTARLTSGGL